LRQVVEVVPDGREHEHLLEVMQQAEALREADRLKAELLATVSHELRSPLTSIKGYAATLLRHERRLPREERHEFLLAIVEASDRLEVIIDRLLEMSQLTAGATAIDRSPVDMRQLAADAIAAAGQRATKTALGQVTFVLQVDEAADPQHSVPMLADVDPHYMRDVLDNLLENAVKYSPNGGTVEVILKLSWPGASLDGSSDSAADSDALGSELAAESAAALHRPSLEIIVRDTGVGIPPEHLGRIFDQFHRVDTRLTREVDGLGLGLALCRRIVELHGGRIWAESSPGDGSAFHVLPLPNWTEDQSEAIAMKG
jgi:signal transduction histidine kinase